MINKVILVGNVGADPEVRALDNGIKMARVRLATTERVYNKEKNETREVTEWHTITLWRGLAEVVDKYIRKGSQLYIEGKLRTREYEKDGVKHYATDIVAEELKMLGKREGVSQSAPQPTPQPSQPAQSIDSLPFDDDIPF
jgi:single-strand DNA-binding protein